MHSLSLCTTPVLYFPSFSSCHFSPQVVSMLISLSLALLGAHASDAHTCDISGAWVVRGRTPSRTGTYVATDLTGVPSVDFNINWDIRHGPGGGNGTYVGANGLRVQVTGE